MKNPSSRILQAWLFPAALALFSHAWCAEIPLERFWMKSPPEQSAPDAPKVLIMYPLDRTRLGYSEAKTRYAGRVEPPNASVSLDGRPIKVWPGGVFTGLIEPAVGENTLTFTAESGGRRTTVTRTVIRGTEPKGPSPWPLEISSIDIEGPPGMNEYWLRPGSKLPIKVRASAGHEMAVRIGGDGAWMPLKAGAVSPRRGGLYEIEIPAESASPGEAKPLEFRITGSHESQSPVKTVSRRSEIRLRRLDGGIHPTGRINKNLGTFLKERTGWQRFGNWIQDTPFPVAERLGDRVRTDLGPGGRGFIEVENVAFIEEAMPPPSLPAPVLSFEESPHQRWMTLDFPCSAPVASIVSDSGSMGRGTITVSLPGASSLGPSRMDRPQLHFSRIETFDRTSDAPPRIEIDYSGSELWGHGWSRPSPGWLRLKLRLRPAPLPGRPLEGLRIMIDAGHGGDDNGALGPSGAAEADHNLITSLELDTRLKALGAVTRQTRASDVMVPLDARVDAALAFDPDLFVSVHHNSVALSADPLSDKGCKVFYHYDFSKPLASAIAAELTAYWSPGEAPRVLTENFRVNRNVSPCPSVLVEVAFVCHPEDEFRLRRRETAGEVAETIAQGIKKLMSGG